MALNDLPRLADQIPGFNELVKSLAEEKASDGKPHAAALDGLAGP